MLSSNDLITMIAHGLAATSLRSVASTDALKNDPFVQHYKSWQDSINQLLDMGVRAEQQAFAVHDLNYVMNNYLPEKLRNAKKFLP